MSNRIYITAWGETKTVGQWIRDRRCHVEYQTLRARVRSGSMSPENMISQPSQRRWDSDPHPRSRPAVDFSRDYPRLPPGRRRRR